MSDAPPVLGDIPQHSEMNIPTLASTNGTNDGPTVNGNSALESAKASVYNSEVSCLGSPAIGSAFTDQAYPQSSVCSRDTLRNTQSRATDTQSAYNTVSNHPVTQSVKDTVNQGLVGGPSP